MFINLLVIFMSPLCELSLEQRKLLDGIQKLELPEISVIHFMYVCAHVCMYVCQDIQTAMFYFGHVQKQQLYLRRTTSRMGC